jgi:hypothetical protein
MLNVAWFHSQDWRTEITIQLIVLGGILVQTVLFPPWIIIGSHGVEYGKWFRTWRFRWSEIHSFSVGQPEVPGVPPLIPGVAYILVKARPTAAPRPHRLPRLAALNPAQLVEYLIDKQAQFSRGRDRGAVRS